MTAVWRGLQYCHQQEVVHRDVKPEIVLMSGYDSIKQADFRMSTNLKPKTFCGIIGYLAPEILTGQSYTSSVNIYASGIMFHEMIHGDIDQFINCSLDDKSSKSSYQPPKTISKDLGDLLQNLTAASAKKLPTALEIGERCRRRSNRLGIPNIGEDM
ncbi:hypothetical protein GCK72_022602 [Caenorhabditis remanei]|uniref:Protein kinase domain-containing protein n=1 Tax=Caenorhabditis remanei TaxID=31234 RepID=A0A6A5FUJ8_CAERE|nr:hypothetical protein GCK72_022602 [Caenorhabditis remanei]KAF1746149.1 hypothetical protein GCK72_022602 [Caenorhabditis remanei]